MSDLTWDEEYGARFKSLSDRDVEVWEKIIEEEIRSLVSGEVLSAVRYLGERKRKGEFKYNPTVEDVISAIIHNRYVAKQQRDGFAPDAECAYCKGSGWVSYIVCIDHATGERSLGTEQHRLNQWPQYNQTTPCLCSQGERAIRGGDDNRRTDEECERMRVWARQVIEWIKTCGQSEYYEDQCYAVGVGATPA